MKILLLFFIIINLNAIDLENKVKELQKAPQKISIVYAKYDPFQKGKQVILKTIAVKETTKASKALQVVAILNSKAFINSKWNSVGDRVDGYKIIQITNNIVLARKNGKIIKIGIEKSKKLLKIRDKK